MLKVYARLRETAFVTKRITQKREFCQYRFSQNREAFLYAINKKGQKACILCPLLFKIATKPISRVLSWTTIFLVCTLPCSSSHLLETAGPTYMFLHDVAPNRVYMAAQSPARRCALTAPFHPYLQCRRYISVALSLGSPPAAVSRYSRPVELGLSSDAAFRRTPAAVRLTRKICEMIGF